MVTLKMIHCLAEIPILLGILYFVSQLLVGPSKET